MKERNIGLDWLKVLAILLIVNFHAAQMYPCYKFLATGADIGNALFFFASGFGLTIKGGFIPWYKRRISRLWPSVLAWCFIAYGINGTCMSAESLKNLTVFSAFTMSPWWFLKCILLFYVLYYTAIRFFEDRLKFVLLFSIAVFCLRWYVVYFLNNSVDGIGVHHACLWYSLFPCMILGGVIARRLPGAGKQHSFGGLFAICLLEVAIYQVLHHSVIHNWGHPVGFVGCTLVLYLLCYHLYMLSQSKILTAILNQPIIRMMVVVIAGLSLEIYISHFILLTSRFNWLFPLNLPLTFLAMVIMAYCVRSLGRFIQQTMSVSERYSWHDIFKL